MVKEDIKIDKLDSKSVPSKYVSTDWKNRTTCKMCKSLVEYSESNIRIIDHCSWIKEPVIQCPACSEDICIWGDTPSIVVKRVKNDPSPVETATIITKHECLDRDWSMYLGCKNCDSSVAIGEKNLKLSKNGSEWDAKQTIYESICPFCKYKDYYTDIKKKNLFPPIIYKRVFDRDLPNMPQSECVIL